MALAFPFGAGMLLSARPADNRGGLSRVLPTFRELSRDVPRLVPIPNWLGREPRRLVL